MKWSCKMSIERDVLVGWLLAAFSIAMIGCGEFDPIGSEEQETQGQELGRGARANADRGNADRANEANQGTPIEQGPTVGKQRLLILPIHSGDGYAPCSMSDLEFFGDTISDWYSEVSYGRLGLSVDVIDWIVAEAPSSYASVEPFLAVAAQDYGLDLHSVTRILALYTGGSGVGESHIGVEPFLVDSLDTSYTINASVSWVTGFECSDAKAMQSSHELGHGMGLGHANAFSFVDGQVHAYGAQVDTMGKGAGAHFSAGLKDHLGWLWEGEVELVTESGEYTLLPLENSPTHVLRVPLDEPGHDLYLEYRQPIGSDSALGYNVYDGVLAFRRVPTFKVGQFSAIALDATPETPSNSSRDFAIMPGRMLSVDGEVFVTTLSANDGQAVVHIEFADGEPNSSPIIQAVGTAPSAVDGVWGFSASVFDPDGDVVDVFWNFGVGNGDYYGRLPVQGQTGYGQFVTRTFPRQIPRRVQLIASDRQGGFSWSYIDIFGYENTPPELNGVELDKLGINTFQFTADVIDDELLAYHWDFGDGASSVMQSPIHFYETPGVYEVTLTVSDGDPITFETVLVDATQQGNIPPVANGGPDPTFVAGSSAVLHGSNSSDPDNQPTSLHYQWSAPPELSLDNPSLANPTVTGTIPGTYAVELWVTDGEDDATDTVTVTVLPAP